MLEAAPILGVVVEETSLMRRFWSQGGTVWAWMGAMPFLKSVRDSKGSAPVLFAGNLENAWFFQVTDIDCFFTRGFSLSPLRE